MQTDRITSRFFKINDQQFIELFAEPVKNYGFIHDIAFETDDVNRTRAYLVSHGVTVPAPVEKTKQETAALTLPTPPATRFG
jgi:hypothetical protein